MADGARVEPGAMTGAPDSVAAGLAVCGWQRLPALLGAESVRHLLARLGPLYDEVDRLRAAAPQQRLSAWPDFVPTASSFKLEAALSEADVAALLGELAAGPVPGWAEAVLRGRALLDRDASWIRRQYPADMAPARHAPHGWHQDGALEADFAAAAVAGACAATLAPMLTCWIALTACGRDAPGLELVAQRQDALLPVAALTDHAVRAHHVPSLFVRPVLAPGDALLITGDCLHRTHLTPAMCATRTSLELRFLAADDMPSRLRHHRFGTLGPVR